MPVQSGSSIRLRILMATLERVQFRAARWAAGSRWNTSSYCWSKPSDDCLKEFNWPSIHQRHTYFSICQVHDILYNRHCISFSDIIFNCPKFVPSISNLLPRQSTHIDIRFLLTVLSYGMQFHIPS